ncbi:MAG: hydrolase family protein, partial [Paucimonas sp.]|nr:hydrolase family protein [Paucimonas sp.]
PKTPFMKFGDTIRIEVLDEKGKSIFGAIHQQVTQYVGKRVRRQVNRTAAKEPGDGDEQAE